MKLDEENVRKHVIAVVKDDPTIPEDELRDGLPVVSIDGVKCAVDTNNGVIQTGEGREQRWFELHLRDVTPKRFLSREQQEAMAAEQEDWWLVSSSQRSCFVRNKKRSGAIMDFLMRFPGEAAFGMDMPEAELARGFEFIDDEGDRIRTEFIAKEVMETVADPPDPPQRPQAATPQTPTGSMGCPPGQCVCGGCYPDPTEASPEPDRPDFKPEDFYFGVAEASTFGGDTNDKWLTVCPKKHWDEHHIPYDGHLDVEHLFPEYLQYPADMEAIWILPDNAMTEDVAIDMTVLGFERNLELEGLLDEVHES
jgi:hypothetical protein